MDKVLDDLCLHHAAWGVLPASPHEAWNSWQINRPDSLVNVLLRLIVRALTDVRIKLSENRHLLTSASRSLATLPPCTIAPILFLLTLRCATAVASKDIAEEASAGLDRLAAASIVSTLFFLFFLLLRQMCLIILHFLPLGGVTSTLSLEDVEHRVCAAEEIWMIGIDVRILNRNQVFDHLVGWSEAVV